VTENEEHLAFYFLIGWAITNWQNVEFALYDVLAAASGDEATGDLYMGFFSIHDFRQKVLHLNQVVSDNISNSQHLSDWKSLKSKIDKAANGRNCLAHYWLLVYIHERPGRRLCLVPRRGILKKKQKVPSGTLCVRDISKLVYRFTALTNALENFAARLRTRPERFPKELEHERPPLTLAEITHELYAFANGSGRS
jgi:hypothetical protein